MKSFVYLLIEVSYERAENELSRNVNFLSKFRFRLPNDFWFPSFLQIAFIYLFIYLFIYSPLMGWIALVSYNMFFQCVNICII